MQNFYQVKTKFSLPQAGADFEYKWFVYQRNNNNYVPEQPSLNNKKAVKGKLATQIINELFTFEEASQLKSVLEDVYTEIGETIDFVVTIEEVDINNLNDHSPLKETYQDGGEFVDPYVFAEFHCNNLDFFVAAKVDNQLRYVAEDFLRHLQEGRLEALRQMHAENNG